MAMAERFATGPPRAALRHVEHVMGMTVSIHVRDEDVHPSALEPALAFLHDVDARFSTYRSDSEVSRLARGSITLQDCGPDVRAVLALADAVRLRTHGFFDVMIRGAGGVATLDPSGIVKGWAVDGAADRLRHAGVRDFCLNAGGDVVARGAGRSTPWRIGLRHPFDPQHVFAVVAAPSICVATSGTYERGAHIVDPHTGRPPVGLASVTVIGDTLAMVDAFATAAFAMGRNGPAWVARQPGYGICAVTSDRRVSYDDDFARFRAA
jgi:thiamine biosynthesis lipoprotein